MYIEKAISKHGRSRGENLFIIRFKNQEDADLFFSEFSEMLNTVNEEYNITDDIKLLNKIKNRVSDKYSNKNAELSASIFESEIVLFINMLLTVSMTGRFIELNKIIKKYRELNDEHIQLLKEHQMILKEDVELRKLIINECKDTNFIQAVKKLFNKHKKEIICNE